MSKINTKNHFLLTGLSAFICLSISSCATKAITKPYSEIFEEAKNNNIQMPTAEEQKIAFYRDDDKNKEKLISVISKRAQETAALEQVYKIGASDEIQISVFDVPELNLTAKVKESGLVDLPLIGTIDAKGKTEAEMLKIVGDKLKNFVINPQVTLFISSYGSQKIAVVGAVSKPGTYPLKKGSNSILELIGEAGGLNDKAGNILNFVPREVSGLSATNDVESRARFALGMNEEKVNAATGIEVSLDKILGTSGGIPLEIPVIGGDMIIVPEAGKVMVDGEVQKVGSYELGRQTTLLGALAAAGGITYSAKVDEVEIVRDTNSDTPARLILDIQKITTGEIKDLKLKNGDIVRVPSHSGRRLRNDTFESITKMINFGVGGSVPLN